jgi:hypothetical protein
VCASDVWVVGLIANVISTLLALLLAWIALRVSGKDARALYSAIRAVLTVLRRQPQGAKFVGILESPDGTTTPQFVITATPGTGIVFFPKVSGEGVVKRDGHVVTTTPPKAQ